MPTPRQIAVIDIGKTNAKLVLIDALSGHQIAAATTPNSVLTDGLYPHMDVARLWDFIVQNLRQFHADHHIDAISITTHGATAALLAGTELALPVLDYEHTGPKQTTAAYADARGKFTETLSPRLPNGLNLGAQIFWQSRTFPDQFARVTAILTYPQYWAWRLTGVLASEVTSLGCHTDLWSPDSGDFSTMVGAEGWTSLFPPIHPAASTLGPITAEIAALTGLDPATPVACGIHDSNASLLPHLGARKPPFTILSTGTWVIAMTVGGATDRLDAARDSLANVDAFGRPVPTARFMGGREFDLLSKGGATPTPTDIERVLTDHIQVYPSFSPGTGPFPAATGHWSHARETLSPGEITAAMSLYLALMTQGCLHLAGIGDEIIIEGPLAKNALFGQALAALTQTPVTASLDGTGTSLGASMLFDPQRAVTGAGTAFQPLVHPDLDTYAALWRRTVQP